MESCVWLQWWHVCTIVVAFILKLGVEGTSELLAYRFTGSVGASNFSYFKLHRDGLVKLVLDSTSGDADVYVSSRTLSPDYVNYELCSATCGLDEVVIPSEMTRPIGVGIFGHPSHEISGYDLTVWVDANSVSDKDKLLWNSDGDSEENVLWSIVLGMLQILLDMLV